MVVHGVFRVDAAAQLNNKKSMMNRLVSIKEDASEGRQLPDYQKETSDVFKVSLIHLVKGYLNLKDALVATDFETAKKTITTLNERLKSIDMSLIKGAAHLYWMEKMPKIKKQLEALKDAKNITYCTSKYEVLYDADALILLTEWKEFRSPDFVEIKQQLNSPIIFDGRNQYNAFRLEEKGFEYFQIGK